MTAPSAKPRLTYLDLTKGFLVVLMVVYHSLNYTIEYQLAFKFLSFLPFSFILITGFLLSRVYAPRYRPGERALLARLFLRGIRLVAIFTALNLAAQFVRSPSYGRSVGVSGFFERWSEVYVFGGSNAAAFDVLLPIAYVILLSPVLIAAQHASRLILPIGGMLLAMACCVLDLKGIYLANLNFVCVGILGMVAGSLKFDPAQLGRWFWISALAYALYFPLGMFRGWMFAVQLLGACVALVFICALSVRMDCTSWMTQRLVRLGQYSLVAYIIQIGFLQVLSRFLGRPQPISIGSFLLFSVTLVAMTLLIEFIEWWRQKTPCMDRAYRAVFA